MPVATGELELEAPEARILLSEEIQNIRSILGPDIPEDGIIRALTVARNNPNRAINILLDTPEVLTTSHPVEQEMAPKVPTENGTVSSLDSKNSIKRELGSGNDDVLMSEVIVKKEELDVDVKNYDILMRERIFKKEESDMDVEKKVVILGEKEESDEDFKKDEILANERKVKKESDEEFKKDEILMSERRTKKEEPDFSFDRGVIPMVKKSYGDDFAGLAQAHFSPYINPRPISAIRPGAVTDRWLQVVTAPGPAEIGEFSEEPDWFLVGKTYVTGLSTCRGRRQLDAGEIVHFSFPDRKKMNERHWGVSAKTRAAISEIVRFSTKRCGEIGKLPTEWSRCLIPLVNSSKVKVQGRFAIPQVEIRLMQEIILYVSFYIHSSIFTEGDKSSWKLLAPSHLDSTIQPLPTMFKLLKTKAFKKAEFTPEELDTRKRSLNLKDDEDDGSTHIVDLAKRRRGGQTYPEQIKDEQAISESALNKLFGAADVYNLEEAEPPSTLVSELRPYQKQALYWMSELEKGIDVEQAAKILHPCWEVYNIADKRASAVYINVFSGEATTQFPSALQMARGGILADAMGLGKTVMTIALILAKPNGESSDDQDTVMECSKGSEEEIKRAAKTKTPSNVKGGTLIVCPMALLGQWKDELEAHSKPGALSVFVHYGGDKTNDPKVISEHHVVLTTYGVLAAAYKSDSEKESIFYKTDWCRVVLDEAHIIKSSKTRVAQSAFALTSHSRWCLTGTPLQNNLEDLYSLLCFLHVEPWCNWAWWNKLIQRPYENGDERGLRLVKSILRPLMLRRTKDTKDKDGSPILVLPPANIQTVECEQSDAERDFYDALFKKSKVRFDQFVAQGKVLHNYASILELLLRLRQCCNHPFLVMSRGDTQQYADLNKLAHCFLEGTRSTPSAVPTRAFVEEVVEGIHRGDATECPICLESASDDPVLTPCAHQMCRECLLSSWRTPSGGPCPICRNPLTKADLITCPTECRFQVDVERNWTESSKITKLLQCLERIRKTGEKSIIFSQWTGFLDLLEIPLRRRRIGFLRFDGKLAQKSRERVLKEFSESRDDLDPWWNPAVEEQAIMRIHRIGQKRQVQVRRFIVKDTVEERMQQVQPRKQRMIAGALTDEEVRSARIEELKMLFR